MSGNRLATAGREARARRARAGTLPAFVRDLFWEYGTAALRWDRDRDLIVGRVLAAGTWEAVTWLRREVGAEGLRDWIESHEGRGLSPPQLRYWQHTLKLPARQVDRWVERERTSVWGQRTHP